MDGIPVEQSTQRDGETAGNKTAGGRKTRGREGIFAHLVAQAQRCRWRLSCAPSHGSGSVEQLPPPCTRQPCGGNLPLADLLLGEGIVVCGNVLDAVKGLGRERIPQVFHELNPEYVLLLRLLHLQLPY
eukprot:766377-Hanusia_phi.AAC.10